MLMRVKKKTQTEKQDKHKQTVEAKSEDIQGQTTDEVEEDTCVSTVSTSTSLAALLENVTSSEREWPQNALLAVITRFGRMPRGGWNKAHNVFCEKYNTNVDPLEFKRRAQKALTTSNGKQCSNREFKLEATKRRKTVIDLAGESSLFIGENQMRTLKIFKEKVLSLKKERVEDVERTKKIPSIKVDGLRLEAVIKSVECYVEEHPPIDMSDIVRILQAAQICYQEVTRKEVKPSVWKDSILKKIESLNAKVELLSRVKDFGKLSTEEKAIAKKIMRELNLKACLHHDVSEAMARFTEKSAVYAKKLEVSQKRKEYRQHNQSFELYRNSFYRQLGDPKKKVDHKVAKDDIKKFWSTMWNKPNDTEKTNLFSEYLLDYLPDAEEQIIFPSYAEFQDIIKYLPNWKAAGCDGVYNFFIKKCTPIHPFLYNSIKDICLNGKTPESWFYKGLTYLIPKGTPTRGSDFRPITCMSNLYKLTTKCTTKVMQQIVESRGLLAENQLGTVRLVQGAKEQAMLNIAINKENNNLLKTMWIDVKKAYDSVDHIYLISCIERLSLPRWIVEFLRATVTQWHIEIRSNSEMILEKKIERGILQGDSLSPLLFVLCMDPLSRKLNLKYPKVDVRTGIQSFATNHLLFIDDLKLLAENEDTLKVMLEETKHFFKTVGLEMNREKSATNCNGCEDDAVVLEGSQGYKYLGILEDSSSVIKKETFIKVKNEILQRVEKICMTKLNGVNMIRAINEHAISVINYHVGLLKLEPEEYKRLDFEIRQMLIKHHIHLQPACKERLYLPRKEMGRGLACIEHRSENMLLNMYNSLNESRNSSLRRAAILKVEEDTQSHLSQIESYLKIKYGFEGIVSPKMLVVAQQDMLYNEIKKRTNHGKLYKARDHELVSIRDSSTWLVKGNNQARSEATYCFLQDRNVFCGQEGQCPHCRSHRKTVDHLATKCDRMLGFDYVRRHNEVVRCIHLLLCKKYGFKKTRKIRSHSVQEVMSNDRAEIRVDTRISTDIKISHNKPDIFVLDKKKKEILIVEVGITNQDLLTIVENEKLRKYDLLANELGLIYKAKTKIIPYVMTWDGVVTNYHKRYIKELEIQPSLEAYIQSVVLKKTLESISLERRRGHDEDEVGDDEVMHRVEKLVESSESINTEISPVNIDGIDKGAMVDPDEIIITLDAEVSNRCENTSVPDIG